MDHPRPGPSVPDAAAVLLVTSRPDLADVVRELAAASGASLRHVARPADAGAAWHRAALVLLGEDVAATPVPSARRDLVLLTGGDPSAWALAATVGAARVVVLPDARGQLLELLAALVTRGPRGRLLGFVGGRGGAGTSTLAVAAGLAAVWSGLRAVVVDGDPLGGGLDVLVGAENQPGHRWPDLLAARGTLRPELLRDGLPEVDGLRLLSWDRSREVTTGALEPDVARVVLDAAAAGHDLVAVDLPRGGSAPDTAVWRLLDAVVLVVPTEVRATLAAVRLADQLRDSVAAVHLVVRTSRRSVVGAGIVADALEMSVTATWPHDDRLALAAERSDVVAALWRRGTRGACEELLGEVFGTHLGTAGARRPVA